MSEPVDLDEIEARRLMAMTARTGLAPVRRSGQEALHKVLSHDVPALAYEVESLREEVGRLTAALTRVSFGGGGTWG